HLATPVVGPAVAHLHTAGRHCIEHAHSGHNFVGAINVHLQTTTTHLLHIVGKGFGGGTQAGKIFRPGGDHSPAVNLLCTLCLAINNSSGRLTGFFHHQQRKYQRERGDQQENNKRGPLDSFSLHDVIFI